jgi:hypothetical protein
MEGDEVMSQDTTSADIVYMEALKIGRLSIVSEGGHSTATADFDEGDISTTDIERRRDSSETLAFPPNIIELKDNADGNHETYNCLISNSASSHSNTTRNNNNNYRSYEPN